MTGFAFTPRIDEHSRGWPLSIFKRTNRFFARSTFQIQVRVRDETQTPIRNNFANESERSCEDEARRRLQLSGPFYLPWMCPSCIHTESDHIHVWSVRSECILITTQVIQKMYLSTNITDVKKNKNKGYWISVTHVFPNSGLSACKIRPLQVEGSKLKIRQRPIWDKMTRGSVAMWWEPCEWETEYYSKELEAMGSVSRLQKTSSSI